MTKAIRKGCTPYDPSLSNEYGYAPSLAAGLVFSILFFLTLTAHAIQAYWKRTWWMCVFVAGTLTELIGWGGRAWSAECPLNLAAFQMQITTLIIGPTFFTAGVYILLGELINLTGGKGKTSILSARMYLIIFCGCDIISLVVQAIGGALASKAVSADPPKSTKTGTHIMVAGIVFQMASITVFAGFFVDFLRRARKLGPNVLTLNLKKLCLATIIACVLIYIRSIYRTIELAQGWKGYLITHEDYFIGFDGSLMFFASAIFNVFHPGWLLSKEPLVNVKSSARSERSPPTIDGQSSDVLLGNYRS